MAHGPRADVENFWKTTATSSESVIREAQWKLFHPTRKKGGGEVGLYDIVFDPGETKNVAVQHADVVKKLSTKKSAECATYSSLDT